MAAAGKYRRILVLGRGGMATVYLASLRSHQGFTKLVVIKDLRPELSESRTFQEMFAEEGRIAARLSHPNVVQTFEVHAEDDHSMSLVMEYLEGQSLAAVQKKLGARFPLAAHLRVLTEVLEGLHYAHQLKDFDGRPFDLVHRDVSPQNVFVTYDGEVKVLDFGIAKAATSEVVTEAGDLKGKLPYMSPEQAMGHPVDRRTDVFAVGVMLWEALAGRRMWHGQGNATILLHLANGYVPPLSLPTDASPELAAIVACALAPNADQRFPDCRAFREALEPFAKGLERRDLGSMLAEAFAIQRRDVTSQIETQLRLAEASRTGEYSPMRLVSGNESSASGLRSRGGTGSQPMQTHPASNSGVLSTAVPVVAPAPSGYSAVLGVAIVGLVVLLGGGALMAQRLWSAKVEVPPAEAGAQAVTPRAEGPTAAPGVSAPSSAPSVMANQDRDASAPGRPPFRGHAPPGSAAPHGTAKPGGNPDNDLGY